jgi:hypothetical protein
MMQTVTVDSQMKYEAVVRNLERLGEIRVDEIYKDTNGLVKVVFRERNFGEFLKESLPWNRSLAKKSREAVFEALKPLVNNAQHSEQLLQNIQDRVDHNFGVTGYALKCDYQPVLRGARPIPLQGGTIASIRKGNGIHLLEADPAKIKCDHAVLLTSTEITELSQYPAHSSLKKILSDFVWKNKQQEFGAREKSVQSNVNADVSVNLLASTWACVTDVELPAVGANQATLDPQDLSRLLEESIKGKQGAVVVEIIPDYCIEKSEKRNYSYTDNGLRAQIAIARKLVNNAKKSNQNLNITFACKDRAVLERMRTIEQPKISGQT